MFGCCLAARLPIINTFIYLHVSRITNYWYPKHRAYREHISGSSAAIAKFAAIRLFFLFIPAAMLNTYSWKVALGHLEVN